MKTLVAALMSVLVLGVLTACSESPTALSDRDHGAVPVLTGNAHFVGTPQISISGNTVTVSGKIAGLGNITQVHVEVTGEAQCVNRGDNEPSADNKDDVAAGADVPVQNGKANFSVTGTATFQPDCSRKMRVEFSNLQITVTDDNGNVLLTFP
jgi:hypothetical protein